MTSEAKIGLLLGLVVIVIIALVVNGLPSFHKNDKSNDLTRDMVRLDNGSAALGEGERQVTRDIQNLNLQSPSQQSGLQPPSQQVNNEIRSITPTPQNAMAGQGNFSNTPPPIQTLSVGNNQPVPNQVPSNVIIGGRQTNTAQIQPSPGTTILPAQKTYTVKSGDSLASISIQFYGQSEGNRLVNIDRIFNANKNILKAKDEIYEGQKLVIPPLPASTTSTTINTTSRITTSNTANQNLVGPVQPSNDYVVADGDNLWKIAEAKLGSGIRYTEIVKLNPALEGNANNIKVGMKLRLPVK
jgi:nucleoid-associated protein YgaU